MTLLQPPSHISAGDAEFGVPAPVKGASLSEQTFDYLKERIVSLQFPPGSPLMENQLAKQLGISRSPMREALARLEKEGLVEIVPWRGARVTQITPKFVVELYQVRSVLEGMAARLAAPRMDKERLGAVRTSMLSLSPLVEAGDYSTFYRHEVEFHDLFVNGCENQLLQATLLGMRDHLSRVRNYLNYNTIPGHAEASFREHLSALEAFLSGSPDAAEAAVRHHLDMVAGRIIEGFRPVS